MKKEELRIGNKVREIEIDRTQYVTYLRVMLAIFNLFLLAGVIALVVYINRWYIYIIDILIVAYCIYRSAAIVHSAKTKHGYTLYSNAIIANSLWYDTAVDLSTIYKVVERKTLLDRITKRGTHSIIIYFKDGGYYQIKLYNLTENVDELINEIMRLSLETRAEKLKANV